MTKQFMIALSSLALAAMLPQPARAQYPDADGYASAQCGNGGWQVRNYPSYGSCYNAALAYYYYQTGTGGGGGVGGGSGGTFVGDLPVLPSQDPCESRICDSGNPVS